MCFDRAVPLIYVALGVAVVSCTDSTPSRPTGARSAPTTNSVSVARQAQSASQSFSCGFSAGDVANGNASNQCTLTITNFDDGGLEYDVVNPIVDSSAQGLGFEYTGATFIPGDLLTISASGCVQAGGHGSTWHNWVKPNGFSCNDLYYGTLTIADNQGRSSAVAGITPCNTGSGPPPESVINVYAIRLSELDGLQIIVGGTTEETLRLGYVDSDITSDTDNGYWSPENSQECPAGDVARISIIVNHGHRTPPPVTSSPYDLVPKPTEPPVTDTNGLLVNPVWGWQANHKNLDDPEAKPLDLTSITTNQATTMNVSATKEVGAAVECGLFPVIGFGILGCLCKGNQGHQNWRDANYTGTLFWQEHSSPTTGDDDYNMMLQGPLVWPCPDGTANCDSTFAYSAGANANNDAPHGTGSKSIRLEFDSDETVDQFDADEGWAALHGAVDFSDANARGLLDGHPAVAVGLVGLDEVHAIAAEVHPVHALAVDVSCTPGVQDWVFFIRNWGDEGECSGDDERISVQQLVLDLPRPIGAPPNEMPTIDSQSNLLGHNTSNPTVALNAAGPTQIEAQLGPPSGKPIAFGHLILNWSTSTVPASCSGLAPQLIGPQVAGFETSSDEDLLFKSGLSLTSSQTVDYQQLFHEMFPRLALDSVPLSAQVQLYPIAKSSSEPTTTAQFDERKYARDLAQITALCIEGAGSLPNFRGGCRTVAPHTQESTESATGSEGWLTTPGAAVALTGRDASGAGIAFSQYNFDGVSWTTYSSPIVLPEGLSTLYFNSVDLAGNTETTQARSFKVDSRPPSVTAVLQVGGTGIGVQFAASDPSPGSGVKGVHYRSLAPTISFHGFVESASGEIHLDTLCTDLEIWAEDVAGNQGAPVRFRDTTAPSAAVAPSSVCLWPPNHPRIRFRLGQDFDVSTYDACDPSPRVEIVGVTSNEPASPSAATFAAKAVCVDRERAGAGVGRDYTASIRVTDYSGNVTMSDFDIAVPHNQPAGACNTAGTSISDLLPCE